MENFGLLIIFAIMASPFILVLVGVGMLFSSKAEKKQLGKILILIGLVLFLIGYAICSNMKGGFH